MKLTAAVALTMILFPPFVAATSNGDGAQAPAPEADAKVVSGMSVLGNSEAPKSLYIVPWKTSGLGSEMQRGPALLDDVAPIDKEVFERELHYYGLTNAKQ